jgi:hypothetical protein
MIIKLQKKYSQDKEVDENNTLRNSLIGTTVAGAGTGITGHLLAKKKLNDLTDLYSGLAWDDETKKSRKKVMKAIDKAISVKGAKDAHAADKVIGEHLDLMDKKLDSMSTEQIAADKKIQDAFDRQHSLIHKYNYEWKGNKGEESLLKKYRTNKLMRNIGYGVAGAGLLGTGASVYNQYRNNKNKEKG